jgi:hypothetical protein
MLIIGGYVRPSIQSPERDHLQVAHCFPHLNYCRNLPCLLQALSAGGHFVDPYSLHLYNRVNRKLKMGVEAAAGRLSCQLVWFDPI